VAETVPLREVALVRSGDKGDVSNLGVIPYDPALIDVLREQVTVERVRALFGPLVRGDIARYEFRGISALNFVMQQALGGGVSRSIAMDTHGKAYASLLLSLPVDVPADTPLRSRTSPDTGT
jgi:hypothetical protein